jgi:T5orf172 domain
MKRLTVEEAKGYRKLDIEDVPSLSQAVAFTLTPCLEEGMEGWEDVTYYGDAMQDPSMGFKKPEWVYVLVNKGMPGVCKIGMTTTSVAQRVQEINSATGVITPWYPVYSYKCLNSYYLEQDVHRYLERRGHRINPSREGFDIDSNTAIAVIESLGSKYQANDTNTKL